MGVNNDGSPKPVKGRMTYGASSRRRRSSKASSSISGGSWVQSSLPLSLRGASFNKATRTSTAGKVRHHQNVRLGRPEIQSGPTRGLLAFNQNSKQERPFDAFVDVPSPFAKQNVVAKKHGYPNPDQDINTAFTDTSTPPFPPLPSHHNSMNKIQFIPHTNRDSDRMSQSVEGYLDAATRAANLQHTRPEWTTWDFVDFFLTNLPQGVKTVDLWRNFKREGEIDLIDIFVTRGGQKDTKARLRFRQVLLKVSPAMIDWIPDRHPKEIFSYLHRDTLSILKMVKHGRSIFSLTGTRKRRSQSQVLSTKM